MKYKILFRILIPVLIIFLMLTSFGVYAASSKCISEIKIVSGKNAVDELEQSGYTAVYRNLNCAPDAKERIYLGYKTGGEKITGLKVSSSLKDSLQFESVTYYPVSNKNLNDGTAGSPVYLYYTRDKKAGSGIVSLATFTRTLSDGADLPDFFGNGSSPVRNTDNAAADFDAGVDGYDLYFFMIREELCLPYVSELKTVEVKAGEKLFEKIAGTGCDYYVDTPVFTGNSVSEYLCYNRTSDKNNAVRYVAVTDGTAPGSFDFLSAGNITCGGKAGKLLYTKSAEIGNAVTDVTVGALMSDSFTLGEWAGSYFGGKAATAASGLLKEEAYESLTASTEKYTQIPVKTFEAGTEKSATNIYTVLALKGLVTEFKSGTAEKPPETSAVSETIAEGTTAFESETEPESDVQTAPENDTEAEAEPKDTDLPDQDELAEDGMIHDTEDTGIVKEETSGENEEEAATVQGSAIGSGSLIAIAVLLMAAVTMTFCFIMYAGRKKKGEKED